MLDLDLGGRIKSMRATFADISTVMDLPGLEREIEELEQQAAEPGLWDDPEAAQKVTSGLSHRKSRVSRLRGVEQRLDDLDVLIELAQEADDEGAGEEAKAELAELERVIGDLEVQTMLSGEYDEYPAVVTIRSGAGGDDATDFAEMLLRMYLRWAEQHDYPTKVLDTSYAEGAGIKSATFEVDAPYAFGTLSVEAGTHRLARISPFGSADKRQTSFAGVEVIPLLAEATEVEVPESDIRVDVFRSSGPGGQSVNTTDSAVRITHLPTGLVVECQDDRSQHRNRAQAMAVLAARLKDMRVRAQQSEISATRKTLIGSGDRSERIRTYNFPQGRITDHRINLTLFRIEAIMNGDLDELIDALNAAHQADQLAALAEQT